MNTTINNMNIENKFTLTERLRLAHKRYKGTPIETDLKRYLKIVEVIKGYDFSSSSDDELKQRGAELKDRACGGASLDDLLPEGYALVFEVIKRVLKMTPYDVQLITAIVLHQGKLAQMKTGEGKTLAAVFPAFLNALTGRGVHIFTANDYLAKRDALWMGEVYRFLGLKTDYVQEKMPPGRRRAAYEADITYLTAKQGGFDLLHDGLQYEKSELVHRPFNMVIVDEADFIMIDEARIPLVIASESPRVDIDPYAINEIVSTLREGIDYRVDRHGRNCLILDPGLDRVKTLLGCGDIYDEKYRNHYAAVNVALHANHLLKRDVDYVVKKGKIELVDEFTGRIADKRRWPYGIQTALEAKEGLDLQPEGKVSGSITIQHYLGLYPKIAALTATAVSAAEEFYKFYNLGTVIIPPNKKEQMVHGPDRIFPTRRAKLAALVEEIGNAYSLGRPVLVGTGSVKESFELAEILRRKGIPCEVLNAQNDEFEADIIAKAGMLGAVTISTNMAGRGTDIKLGGEKGLHRERIISLGGLYVIGTNRYESRRVDLQLRGRAGRQGDPGLSCFFISFEDELMRKYGIMEFIPPKYLKDKSGKAVIDPRVAKEVFRAQSFIEDEHFEIKKTLRRYSELVERQRRIFQNIREAALVRRELPEGMIDMCGDKIDHLQKILDKEIIIEIMVRILLTSLDRFWTGHLASIEDLKEGIHLRRYSGKNPLHEFIEEVSGAFDERLDSAIEEAAGRFSSMDISAGGIDFDREGLKGPSSTWTYLINDKLPNFNVAMIATNNIGFASVYALQGLFVFIGEAVSRVIGFIKEKLRSRKG